MKKILTLISAVGLIGVLLSSTTMAAQVDAAEARAHVYIQDSTTGETGIVLKDIDGIMKKSVNMPDVTVTSDPNNPATVSLEYYWNTAYATSEKLAQAKAKCGNDNEMGLPYEIHATDFADTQDMLTLNVKIENVSIYGQNTLFEGSLKDLVDAQNAGNAPVFYVYANEIPGTLKLTYTKNMNLGISYVGFTYQIMEADAIYPLCANN